MAGDDNPCPTFNPNPVIISDRVILDGWHGFILLLLWWLSCGVHLRLSYLLSNSSTFPWSTVKKNYALAQNKWAQVQKYSEGVDYVFIPTKDSISSPKLHMK